MAVSSNGLSAWDIVAIVAYFVVVLAIGFFAMCRANRGTLSGYFLAGRYMTWLPVGASLFASNIGTEHFVGLTGSGAAGGVGVAIFEISSIITIQLLGWVFLPVYIASGASTLPEYLGKRFGGQRIRVYLAVLSLIMYIFTKLSVDLFSGSLFMKTFFGWNIYASILLVLAMTAVCTVSGGLTAVMYTETLQCILMIFGGSFVAIYSYVEVGGYEGVMTKYWSAVPNDSAIANSTCGHPTAKSFQMLRAVDDNNLPWLGFMFGQMFVSIWYWAADQLIVQRALAAKNISHAQGGTMLTGYFKILPMFLMVIPGMISRILYPNEVGCVTNCLEVCGSASGCSNIAFPKLVLDLMPAGFRGLMFAVMVAALMGNISAVFNSSSTLFTMDVYSKIRPAASTRELLIVGRIFILVLIGLSILWIPVIERQQGGQLFLYMQSMFSYAAPPIAVSFLFAILWPRCNEPGIFYAMMIGLLLGAIRMILDFVYAAPPCGVADTRPAIIAKVHFTYFAMMLAGVSALTIVVVSLLTKPPPRHRLIRTTYWSRKDKTERDDDNKEMMRLAQEQGLNKEQHCTTTVSTVNNGMLSPPNTPVGDYTATEKIKESIKSGYNWFCGYNQTPKTSQQVQNLDAHLRQITSLEQTWWQKVILLINTVILLVVAVGVIMFFSIWSPKIALQYKPVGTNLHNG